MVCSVATLFVAQRNTMLGAAPPQATVNYRYLWRVTFVALLAADTNG